MGFPGGVTFRPGEPEMISPIRELVPSLFRRCGHQPYVPPRLEGGNERPLSDVFLPL